VRATTTFNRLLRLPGARGHRRLVRGRGGDRLGRPATAASAPNTAGRACRLLLPELVYRRGLQSRCGWPAMAHVAIGASELRS